MSVLEFMPIKDGHRVTVCFVGWTTITGVASFSGPNGVVLRVRVSDEHNVFPGDYYVEPSNVLWVRIDEDEDPQP